MIGLNNEQLSEQTFRSVKEKNTFRDMQSDKQTSHERRKGNEERKILRVSKSEVERTK